MNAKKPATSSETILTSPPSPQVQSEASHATDGNKSQPMAQKNASASLGANGRTHGFRTSGSTTLKEELGFQAGVEAVGILVDVTATAISRATVETSGQAPTTELENFGAESLETGGGFGGEPMVSNIASDGNVADFIAEAWDGVGDLAGDIVSGVAEGLFGSL